MLDRITGALVPLPWPSRPKPAMAIGAAVLAFGFFMGWALKSIGALGTGELFIDQWLANHRRAPWTQIAEVINVALGGYVGPLVGLGICLLIAIRHRTAALAFAVTAGLSLVAVPIGKVAISRPRPPTEGVVALVSAAPNTSFPSGHTAFAASLVAGMIVALQVVRRRTGWAWIVGCGFIALAAWSRMYVGVHYLGDTIGGVLFVFGSLNLLGGVGGLLLGRRSRQTTSIDSRTRGDA